MAYITDLADYMGYSIEQFVYVIMSIQPGLMLIFITIFVVSLFTAVILYIKKMAGSIYGE